jgi:hypothetical protein
MCIQVSRRSSVMRQLKPWAVSRWAGKYTVLACPWFSLCVIRDWD